MSISWLWYCTIILPHVSIEGSCVKDRKNLHSLSFHWIGIKTKSLIKKSTFSFYYQWTIGNFNKIIFLFAIAWKYETGIYLTKMCKVCILKATKHCWEKFFKDLNKTETETMLTGQKIQYCQNVNFSQDKSDFDRIPIKILASSFVGIAKMILKFVWKMKGLE